MSRAEEIPAGQGLVADHRRRAGWDAIGGGQKSNGDQWSFAASDPFAGSQGSCADHHGSAAGNVNGSSQRNPDTLPGGAAPDALRNGHQRVGTHIAAAVPKLIPAAASVCVKPMPPLPQPVLEFADDHAAADDQPADVVGETLLPEAYVRPSSTPGVSRAVPHPGGQKCAEHHSVSAARAPLDGSHDGVDVQQKYAAIEPSARGHRQLDSQSHDAPGGVAEFPPANQRNRRLIHSPCVGGREPGIIAEIVALHRRAQFAERQRIALSNRFLAFLRVEGVGFSTHDDETARAKAVKAAAALRKALAGVGPAVVNGRELPAAEFTALRALAISTDAACEPFLAIERTCEKSMARLAASLPGAGFVVATRGLGFTGFAMLVGEAGDIGSYANPAKLWKRLGLAIIGSERQRRISDAVLAEVHGYNPRRRSISWRVFDSCFRGQSTDPPEPYRTIYDTAKATYLERGWTKMHAHNAAKRKAEKTLLRDLWKAWRQEAA